jgi:hypothetical protein
MVRTSFFYLSLELQKSIIYAIVFFQTLNHQDVTIDSLNHPSRLGVEFLTGTHVQHVQSSLCILPDPRGRIAVPTVLEGSIRLPPLKDLFLR